MKPNYTQLTVRGVSTMLQGFETARNVLDTVIAEYRELLRAAENGALDPKRRGRPPKEPGAPVVKHSASAAARKRRAKKNTGGWGNLTPEARAARIQALAEVQARRRAAKLAAANGANEANA